MARRSGIAAVMVAVAVCAGGAARGALPTPDVPAKLQGAVALEKQALKDFDKGKVAAVEKELKQSKALLLSAGPGIPATGDFDLVRADIRQAINGDDAALTLLHKPKEHDLVHTKINVAILRKSGALEAFGFGQKIASAPPPSVDAPLRVTGFEAALLPPRTYFKVVATDPDDPILTYDWKNTNTCGSFAADPATTTGSSATWNHGEDTNCSHDGPFHDGTITVTVSDKHTSCTVTDPDGSLSVAPFDPGEDCKTQPPEPVTTLDDASATALLNQLGAAIAVEKDALKLRKTNRPRALLDLSKAVGQLKRMEVDVTNALAASSGAQEAALAKQVLRDLHEAELLDGEAAYGVAKGLDAGQTDIERALVRKHAVEVALSPVVAPDGDDGDE